MMLKQRILPDSLVATEVTFEDYLEHHAEQRREWLDRIVVSAMAIEERHDLLHSFLRKLLDAYFALNPIAVVRAEPYVMRLPMRGREPDLMIVMNDNPHPRTCLYLDGPADIVIEIVAPGSERTDLGDKFVEYEAAGVREYWIIDHVRRRTYFYRLDDECHYILRLEDADGVYTTPLLPQFKLHVPTLWRETLPDDYAIGDLVKRTWEGE